MQLDYSKPLLMGILNVTPDSFSDGRGVSVFERGHCLRNRNGRAGR